MSKSKDFTTQYLGDSTKLTNEYSYPNSKPAKETLSDTILLYSNQSIERDCLKSHMSVKIEHSSNGYSACVYGSSSQAEPYGRRLADFLDIGGIGYEAFQSAVAKRAWDPQKGRFLLPLGLALQEQLSVQLLHFPPDYTLDQQNYLGSKTSERWETLLELNGVAQSDVTRYETIVDLCPIATSDTAGAQLTDTIPYFEDYASKMLAFSLTPSGPAYSLPLVAYGSPARQWFSNTFLKKKPLDVCQCVTVSINGGPPTPVLGANHPSYIWSVAKSHPELAFTVVEQDLIAARWQAHMGQHPKDDPQETLKEATEYWKARPSEVNVLTQVQAFGKTAEEAKHSGHTLPATKDLEALSKHERSMQVNYAPPRTRKPPK